MASFHSLCRRANAHLWDPQRSEEKNGGSSLRLLAPKLSGDETGKTHVQLHLQEAAGNEEEAKKVQKCYSLHVSYIDFFLLKKIQWCHDLMDSDIVDCVDLVDYFGCLALHLM